MADLPADCSALARQAAEYHELATKLSRQIEQFEEWLRALPGKVPASVPFDWLFDGYLLSFERSGATWQLVLYRGDVPLEKNCLGPLVERSVEFKAEATLAFPQLAGR